MPVMKTNYLCNICGKQVNNYADASMCELHAVPPNMISIGSMVSVECEDSGLGVRWSYFYEDCQVGAAFVIPCNVNGHRWVYGVTSKRGERLAFFNNDGNLISPAEHNYRFGFIQNLISERITDGLMVVY